MNILLLLAVALLVGCSGPRKGLASVRINPTQENQLRYPEVLGRYHVGRYVDEENGAVMHEAHPFYRIESAASWNLRPGPAVGSPASQHTILPDAAFREVPLPGEAIAEFNRQRELTREVLKQTGKLDGVLAELSAAIVSAREVAARNSVLRQEISEAIRRIETLEAEVRHAQPADSIPSQEPVPGGNPGMLINP